MIQTYGEFSVTEADRVYVVVNGKPVSLGYNHWRAWNAMRKAAGL